MAFQYTEYYRHFFQQQIVAAILYHAELFDGRLHRKASVDSARAPSELNNIQVMALLIDSAITPYCVKAFGDPTGCCYFFSNSPVTTVAGFFRQLQQ